MIRKPALAAAVILIIAAAAFLRLPDLGNRPFHGDEAVHAFKFQELWTQHAYRYDPNEYHGPTIYYAALPIVWGNHRENFADTTEADFRLAIALFGIAMAPLALLLHDAIGKRGALFAALLLAISPAFVFYSRYYIQEVLLTCFSLGMIVCGWRFHQSRKRAWMISSASFAGLMVATKETAILAFVAAGVAMALTRRSGRTPVPEAKGSDFVRNVALVTSVSFGVAYLVLSGFLSHLAGPLDYFKSYTPWLHRASGTALHNHPWNYYLSLLTWNHGASGPVFSEGFILLMGILGACFAFRSHSKLLDQRFARFAVFYTAILTVIYSAIPYKTPWCALSFLCGWIVLAGMGAEALLQMCKTRPSQIGAVCLMLVCTANLAHQSHLVSTTYETDARNPYVYAQPAPDVIALGKRVGDLAAAHSLHNSMTVKVISKDEYYWPIPWYLRQLTNVGYYTESPKDPFADVVIASTEFDEALTKKLDPTHIMTGFYGLRAGAMLEVWVKMDLWTEYVRRLPKQRDAQR